VNRGPVAVLAALSLVGLAGCAIDLQNGSDSGTPYAITSGRAWYSTDPAGHLLVAGHALALPSARENRRFGATFVDVSPLARPLRPLTALDGGIVIGAVRSDSPLALAGARAFERVVAIDGETVASLSSLVETLERARDGQKLRLSVVARPEPVAPVSLERVVEVGEDLDAGHQVWIPWVFEHTSHADRRELTIGPGATIFFTLTEHELSASETYERNEWGAFFNVLLHRSRDRIEPDGTRQPLERTLRIFYFIDL
jgi:hypothetical protein